MTCRPTALTPSKVNYQFSPFVAEMVNSLSKLVTILLGIYGGYVALQQKLPARYPLGFFVCIVLAPFGRRSSVDAFV